MMLTEASCLTAYVRDRPDRPWAARSFFWGGDIVLCGQFLLAGLQLLPNMTRGTARPPLGTPQVAVEVVDDVDVEAVAAFSSRSLIPPATRKGTPALLALHGEPTVGSAELTAPGHP